MWFTCKEVNGEAEYFINLDRVSEIATYRRTDEEKKKDHPDCGYQVIFEYVSETDKKESDNVSTYYLTEAEVTVLKGLLLGKE